MSSKTNLIYLMLAAAILPAIGCGTGLRAPLCTEGEVAFPPEAAGRYRVAVPQRDAANSGAWTNQEETEFILRDDGDHVQVAVTKALLQSVTRRKTSAPGTRGRDWAAEDELGLLPLAVCRIGNAYYSQTRQDNGTYSIARFDLSPTGITTADLAFRPAELRAAGIPFHFLPAFDEIDKNGKWRFETTEPTRLIVDNTGIQSREQLVALAHPIALGLVYTRISSNTALPEGKAARMWRTFRVKK